ncbi:MAG: hypothetical protein ACYCYI_07325 [Saccharofermentanales bacterium]
MEYNDKKFLEILYLIKDFLYHYESYKEIHKVYDKLPGEKEFWRYTCDAHLEMANISWCMIFGSDSNETHWKKIAKEEIQAFRKSFINFLSSNGKMTHDEYKCYWNEMCDFRNRYVAHKNEYNQPVPHFDNACLIIYNFDSWIRQQIKPDILDFPSYEELSDEYRTCIKRTLDLLISGKFHLPCVNWIKKRIK